MKDFYKDKIKRTLERIVFFEKILDEEKKELEHYKKCLKEWEIDEKVEDYKKQLEGENKDEKQ